MMRRRVFHPPHPPGRVNVTPMIDVIMVLIVFYLIVGRMAAESRVGMPLPMASSGSRDVGADPLVINILPESGGVSIEVEQRRFSPTELAQLIEGRIERRPETIVQIRADRTLAWNAVDPVISACRAAGASVVRIATEPSE